MKIFLFKMLHVVFFTYVLLAIVLFIAQRSLIYPADKTRPRTIEGIETAKVVTKDGLNLESWFIAGSDPKGKTIIFFHGNGGNYGHRFGKALVFTGQGYSVLLAEYRGYGGNPGRPSEQGLYDDARAFMDFLITQKQIPEEDIIIYGESLGSGVAVQMATEHKPHALILETPFSSLADVVKRLYFFMPVDLMLKDRFMSIEKIGAVSSPILFLHGHEDEVIPFDLSKKLFEAANEPKTFAEFPKGNHNNLYEFGAPQKILDFLSGIARNNSE